MLAQVSVCDRNIRETAMTESMSKSKSAKAKATPFCLSRFMWPHSGGADRAQDTRCTRRRYKDGESKGISNATTSGQHRSNILKGLERSGATAWAKQMRMRFNAARQHRNATRGLALFVIRARSGEIRLENGSGVAYIRGNEPCENGSLFPVRQTRTPVPMRPLLLHLRGL